jgi:hypothetical protein
VGGISLNNPLNTREVLRKGRDERHLFVLEGMMKAQDVGMQAEPAAVSLSAVLSIA